MTTPKARFGYTEKDMADAFLELLRSREGLPDVGPFDGVYREISCRQGRPDFIALRNRNGCQPLDLRESHGFVDPAILTILKPTAPRTLSYLTGHSEFSESSLRRSLRQLAASGHVERTETGAYRLGSAVTQLQAELWAFELKLDNPRRALFQAKQSRTYADRTIIVVPPGQERNYRRYSAAMTRWGIGLYVFDVTTSEIRMFRRGRRFRPLSLQHQFYTIARLQSVTRGLRP